MHILDKDELQDELKMGKLTDREIVWILLYLRDDGLNFPLEKFGAANMCRSMANHIYKHRLDRTVREEMNISFLPERDFDWIEKGGRQPRWLLHRVLRDKRIDTPSCPTHLSAREELITLFDYSKRSLDRKKSYLEDLQKDWVQHKAHDRLLNWFTKGEVKQKCETAWQWYYDTHPKVVDKIPAFKSVEDILFALDCRLFSAEEVEHHITQIKKKLKAKQVAEHREGKPQTNLALEAKDRTALQKLAKQERQSMTEVIRRLIWHADAHGMPPRSEAP